MGAGDFNGPQGVKIDPFTDNVYVADGMNNRIQVFSCELEFLFEFGIRGKKKYIFHPTGICIHSGLVYVATGVSGIYFFTLEGDMVTSSYYPENSIYRTISAIAVDGGDTYVCDKTGNQIVVLYTKGPCGEVFARGLKGPCDIKITKKSILVLEGIERKIIVLSKDGNLISAILIGDKSSSNKSPEFFDVDPWGRILVSDCSQGCIKIYSRCGKHIHDVGGSLFNNKGIAVDKNQRIVTVCENQKNRLRIF